MPARMPLLHGLAAVLLGACLLWTLFHDVEARPSADDEASTPSATLHAVEAPGLRGRAPVAASRAEESDKAASAEQADGVGEPEVSPEAEGMLLRVRTVAAETGQPLRVPWRPSTAVAGEHGRFEQTPHGAHALQPMRPTSARAGAAASIDLEFGQPASKGFVCWDRAGWLVDVSRYTRSLMAVYPLRSEARVRVTARDHDGTPTPPAAFGISGFLIAGRHVTDDLRSTADADGHRLHGVPYFRAQPLEILAQRIYEDVEEVEVETKFEALIADFSEERRLRWEEDWWQNAALGRGVLPRRSHELLAISVTFPAPSDEGLFWGGSGRGFSSSCSCGGRPRDMPRGSVELEVLRRDGRAAVGARVELGFRSARVDAHGFVRFDDVRVGTVTATLVEHGLVATSVSTTVTADTLTRAVLRESEGGTLDVRVLAHDGSPAPYADVRLPRTSYWVDLEGGVQRIDHFADHAGVRVLERVPARTLRVTARWAGLRRSVEVQARDGVRTPVTITLPEPETD